MSRTGVRSHLTTFCQLRPYRHELCPGTIEQAIGDWTCACDCGHERAKEPAAAKKRRVVKTHE